MMWIYDHIRELGIVYMVGCISLGALGGYYLHKFHEIEGDIARLVVASEYVEEKYGPPKNEESEEIRKQRGEYFLSMYNTLQKSKN